MPKTVSEWEAKGWLKLDLSADQPAVISYDQATQHLEMKGQVFGADGNQVTGKDRPRIITEETDGGSVLTAAAAATVLYKVVDNEAA